MKIFIIILLLPFTLFSQNRYVLECDSNLIDVSKYVLLQQVGVKELTGRNDGKQIKAYLKSVGIRVRAPYCQAGQYYCFDEACEILGFTKDMIPIKKSGVAISSYRFAKKTGLKTKYIPKVNDLIIWKKGSGWQGHIERIIYVGETGWVLTVGFNVNDGVLIIKRNIYYKIGILNIYGLVGFE